MSFNNMLGAPPPPPPDEEDDGDNQYALIPDRPDSAQGQYVMIPDKPQAQMSPASLEMPPPPPPDDDDDAPPAYGGGGHMNISGGVAPSSYGGPQQRGGSLQRPPTRPMPAPGIAAQAMGAASAFMADAGAAAMPPPEPSVFRPPGVLCDGLMARGAAYDNQKKLRWFMLFKDRLEYCEKLPTANKPVQTQGVIQLLGCEIQQITNKGKCELLIKEKKGKKHQLGVSDLTELEKWQTALNEVMAKMPKPKNRRKGRAPPVFKTPLQAILDWERQEDDEVEVPLIVRECIDYLMRDECLNTEGIFRLSGSLARINELKAKYDAHQDSQIAEVPDANVVSGTLKLWLRELPTPLLEYQNYAKFIDAARRKAPDELDTYRQIIETLPPENFALLKEILYLARAVADRSEQNKMTPDNLAIVIGPNLLKSETEDMLAQAQDSQFITEIFKKLIETPERFVGPKEAPAPRSGQVGRAIAVQSGGPPNPAMQQVFNEMRMLDPSNAACADCGAADPMFGNFAFGVLVCDQCKVAHDNAVSAAGDGVEYVLQSMISGKLASPLVGEYMKATGNRRTNAVLEVSMPPSAKPTAASSTEQRSTFVLDKYVRRSFATFQMGELGGPPLLSAAAAGDWPSVHRLCLLGANVHYRDESKGGVSPLHEAVRGGHLLPMLCLVQLGADVAACAHDGSSPIDVAHASQNAAYVEFLTEMSTVPRPAFVSTAAAAAASMLMPPSGGSGRHSGSASPNLPPRRAPPQQPQGSPGPPPQQQQQQQQQAGPPPTGARQKPFVPRGAFNMAGSGRNTMRAAARGLRGGPGRRGDGGGRGVPGRRGAPGPGRRGAPPAHRGGGGAPPPSGFGQAAAKPAPDPAYVDIGGIDLTAYDWFHGKLSSSDAYHKLSSEPKGTFLVRNSSRAGCFVVSWVSNDEGLIIHTLTQPVAGPLYEIEGDRNTYKNMPAIVEAYQAHLIRHVPNGGVIR